MNTIVITVSSTVACVILSFRPLTVKRVLNCIALFVYIKKSIVYILRW